jgi:hypothetical protein
MRRRIRDQRGSRKAPQAGGRATKNRFVAKRTKRFPVLLRNGSVGSAARVYGAIAPRPKEQANVLTA